MMDLLLDTHVAIWWMEGSDRLGSRCTATLFQPGARLWISTVSVWEMAIKSGLGRLKLSTPLDECIPDLFARGALCLQISLNHALAVRTLPPHHADPFDRMLVAQAHCENLTLVTGDTLIRAYDIRTLDAAV
jgi:PIN domain nuclease of toxin-antitoxin system